MEIKKQPETEIEYWEAISGLSTFIWSTKRNLAEGIIEDPTGNINEDIIKARKTSNRLIKEACKKFGLIHPRKYPKVKIGQKLSPPAEGKTYYWRWYYKMKAEYYKKKKAKL